MAAQQKQAEHSSKVFELRFIAAHLQYPCMNLGLSAQGPINQKWTPEGAVTFAGHSSRTACHHNIDQSTNTPGVICRIQIICHKLVNSNKSCLVTHLNLKSTIEGAVTAAAQLAIIILTRVPGVLTCKYRCLRCPICSPFCQERYGSSRTNQLEMNTRGHFHIH